MTVGKRPQGGFTIYGYFASPSFDALSDTTIDYETESFTISHLGFHDGPIFDEMAINLNAFVPRESLFNFGGTTYTTDAAAE